MVCPPRVGDRSGPLSNPCPIPVQSIPLLPLTSCSHFQHPLCPLYPLCLFSSFRPRPFSHDRVTESSHHYAGYRQKRPFLLETVHSMGRLRHLCGGKAGQRAGHHSEKARHRTGYSPSESGGGRRVRNAFGAGRLFLCLTWGADCRVEHAYCSQGPILCLTHVGLSGKFAANRC